MITYSCIQFVIFMIYSLSMMVIHRKENLDALQDLPAPVLQNENDIFTSDFRFYYKQTLVGIVSLLAHISLCMQFDCI